MSGELLQNLVKTSYLSEDVTMLLQDVEGRVPILGNEERAKRMEEGVHYSEMLPDEYVPTPEYMDCYIRALSSMVYPTAASVASLAEKLYEKFKGRSFVIVSLARAGTPVGILVKHYMMYRYHVFVPHYSVSIIRGKGIDMAAMRYIAGEHGAGNIQFLDGWIGKGMISYVLEESCRQLLDEVPDLFSGIDPSLAVLSDPACVTNLYGTRQDFLIPSACLNATVSGLVSRTVKMPDMGDDELHGAVYYKKQELHDESYHFIHEVEKYFPYAGFYKFNPSKAEIDESFKGMDEVQDIMKRYGISDLNKVKPGIGETTRVLLRRIPDRVLVSHSADRGYLEPVMRLCKEKCVPVEEYPFRKYNVCGIIR